MCVSGIRTHVISLKQKCLILLTITVRLLQVPLLNCLVEEEGIEPSLTAPKSICKIAV